MKRKWKTRRIKCTAVIGLLLVLSKLWEQVCYAQEMDQFTYESPIFFENEKKNEPEMIIEQSGKTYHRISLELREAEEAGRLHSVSTSVSYELEGNQEPPDSAMITLIDDQTGECYDREVSRKEIIENGSSWETGFSFPLTVYGYDADTFILGDYEIPSSSSLAEYSTVFLETMGLSEDVYRIERIEWNGECYEEEGVLCRDAVAYGEKLIRQVEVVYGGQIRTPDRIGKQYVAIYEEEIKETIEESTEEIGTSAEKISEETIQKQEMIPASETGAADKIKQWIREHVTEIAFGGLFFVGILFLILFLWLSRRQKSGEAGD